MEVLQSGRLHQIRPGTLYAMNNHDRHRIRAITEMHISCTFVPTLTGHEVHDADGSLCGEASSGACIFSIRLLLSKQHV